MAGALQANTPISITEGQINEINALTDQLNNALSNHEKAVSPISDLSLLGEADPDGAEGSSPGSNTRLTPDSEIGKRLFHVQNTLQHMIARVNEMTARLRV
ncbi:hypothetical protein D3C87_1049900 [compost metagenome]